MKPSDLTARVSMFRVDKYGDTWLSTNPSPASIRKAVKGAVAGGYAVELRRPARSRSAALTPSWYTEESDG